MARRHHLEQHEVQEVLDTRRPALDRAVEPAGLPVEMEAQRQSMQVLEGFQGHLVHGLVRHAGEHDLAQLAEGLRENARAAIGEHDADRHHDGSAAGAGKRVDGVAVEKRNNDRGEFGSDQQQHGGHDADADFRPVLRPEIGEKPRDGADFMVGNAWDVEWVGGIGSAHRGNLGVRAGHCQPLSSRRPARPGCRRRQDGARRVPAAHPCGTAWR
jgi:hypothetical protein